MPGHTTSHGTDAGALRERARLWRGQLLFATAQAAGTIGVVWLSATRGGGPAAAALIVAAGLAPLAVGTAPAALLVAHVSRRVLLRVAQLSAAVALGAVIVTPGGTNPLAMAGALALVGAARAVFDATAADVLQQLVAPDRTHDAMGDLTRRFAVGQASGLAVALAAGLIAGPAAAVLVAAGAAAAGALLAAGHGSRIDLRPDGAVPLHRAIRAGAVLAARDRGLRRTVAGGAVSVAIGAALSAMLVLWLRDGVGLRGSLVPALALGLLAVRLARPLLVRAASRVGSRGLVAVALTIQAAAALTADAAGGATAAAAAFALSIASGAFLATLITRAHRGAAPSAFAPGIAVVCGAAWALAAAAGAVAGGGLALTVGLDDTYPVRAAAAAAAAAATLAPALRPAGGRA
jgi:hypothetical protein